MPVFRPAAGVLEALHASLAAQSHGDFELCLAPDGPQPAEVARSLAALAARDARVRLAPESAHAGIAAATNRAAALATGELLALVDQDDLLPRDALLAVAGAFADDPELELVYTDEDQLETWGLRDGPRFKPGASPVLLLGVNYVMHLLVLRRPLFDALGGLRPGFDGAQDHDLALRAFERARVVRHLRHVAYTWRRSPASVAGGAAAKPWAYEAGRRAVEEAVRRQGLPVSAVRHAIVPGMYGLDLAPRARALPCRVVFQAPDDEARWARALRDAGPELRVLSTHGGGVPAQAFAGDAALLVVAPGLAPAARALATLARFAAWPGVGAVAAGALAHGRGTPVHVGFGVDRAGRALPIPPHGVAALCPREVATSAGGLLLVSAEVAARAQALADAPLQDEDVACLALAAHAAGRSALFVPRAGLAADAAAMRPARELALSRSVLWCEVAPALPGAFFEGDADRFCPRHPLLVAAGHPPPVD